MSQTPEGKVKQFIDRWLKANFPGAWIYKPQGGFYGRAGVPDYVVLWKGIFFCIEAKAENGVVSTMQMTQLKHIQAMGGISCICVGKDIAKLERLKDAVLRRLHMANEEPKASAI